MTKSLRAIVLLCLGLLGLGLLAWLLLIKLPSLTLQPKPQVPIAFNKISFAELEGWQEDRHEEAIKPLLLSCPRALKKNDKPLSTHKFPGTSVSIAGRGTNWVEICHHAEGLAETGRSARDFFEMHFVAFEVTGADPSENLFTGYYEPVLDGSRQQTERFSVPLLQRPTDLVHVELGNFRAHLKGERIAGRVVSGHLRPYESRAEIEQGKLEGISTPLIYLDNAVDAFFTQIQGSARIELDDGTHMRVNYDGQNGHPYTAIGAPLIRRGEIAREDMSMAAIRQWLATHPDQAQDLMNENASFIFFREVEIEDPSLGPIGAAGVGLTSGRSIAVDRKFHALGLLFWIETSQLTGETTIKDGIEQHQTQPYHRLMVAQDTGGAIRGPARADIFFGTGDNAAKRAGPMKSPGRMVILVPRPAADAYDQALEELAREYEAAAYDQAFEEMARENRAATK